MPTSRRRYRRRKDIRQRTKDKGVKNPESEKEKKRQKTKDRRVRSRGGA
jgi:hypothetical protein